MKLTKILILLLAFWLEPLSASPYFSFKKYQVEDGLSHNTVWCAIQDSYGFIWLGTSDGLNRYDGRGNKVYRNVLNDKFSLENNFVGFGVIWLTLASVHCAESRTAISSS